MMAETVVVRAWSGIASWAGVQLTCIVIRVLLPVQRCQILD